MGVKNVYYTFVRNGENYEILKINGSNYRDIERNLRRNGYCVYRTLTEKLYHEYKNKPACEFFERYFKKNADEFCQMFYEKMFLNINKM